MSASIKASRAGGHDPPPLISKQRRERTTMQLAGKAGARADGRVGYFAGLISQKRRFESDKALATNTNQRERK